MQIQDLRERSELLWVRSIQLLMKGWRRVHDAPMKNGLGVKCNGTFGKSGHKKLPTSIANGLLGARETGALIALHVRLECSVVRKNTSIGMCCDALPASADVGDRMIGH